MIYRLAISLLLVSVLARGNPLPQGGDKPKSPPNEKKIRKILKREAHYFSLIASKKLRKNTAQGGNAGSVGGFGSGRGAWSNAHTYAGILTPRYKGRLFVVGAATVPETEKFEQVRVYFQNKRGKGFSAEYVGRDPDSKLIVFRLKKARLGAGFRLPSPPSANLAFAGGEQVVSLGHPYSPTKKAWDYWAVSFGRLRQPPFQPAPKHWPLSKLGPLIRHDCNPGKHSHLWHGGPLVRLAPNDKLELLGLNVNSMRGINRALPYSVVLEIRNRVIDAALDIAAK